MEITKLILMSSLVTVLLRFLPFWIFKNKKTPELVQYLGKVLPYAIMAMLVVYCLKNIDLFHAPFGISELIASSIVALSYVYKRNTLLSVVIGTLTYMLLLHIF